VTDSTDSIAPVSPEDAARALYQRLIAGWNDHDAEAMAAAVAEDGLVIGFDGSQMSGREAVAKELGGVFSDHETAAYVVLVRSVIGIGADAALLHAVAGMIPPGSSDVMPDRNQIQTVVVRPAAGDWAVALFQTTPARFDGRPELSEALTAELSEQLTAQG
jgi:uncharacterized protein (TIGR02246 family)